MKLTTTLRLLRQHNACEKRYRHLVAALGLEWGDDKPIPLLRILKENGVADALWALRAGPENQTAARNRIARLFAADCAVRVLHLFEAKYPTNTRPRDCIIVARWFASGKATQEELASAYASAASAYAAASYAYAASAYAAYADAAFAAADAAFAAAAAVYADASYAASQRKWQAARLDTYLRSPTTPRPIPLPRRAK